jgi:type IV secretion system protein VirB8
MNKPVDPALTDYYRAAETWAEDRREDGERRQKVAWIVAAVAGTIAVLEGIALIVLLPLKQIEPYAVLVDRQTGFVQPLNLAKGESIVPDQALVQSMLAQYVTAREGFNLAALKEDYRKVALWSAGPARSQYVAGMQATNPSSPLTVFPRSAVVAVEIRSISPLSADTALVRFSTLRADQGGVPVEQGVWAAVIRYRFSSADMSAASRLVNPLGFQVTGYTRNSEVPPGVVLAAPLPQPAALPGAVVTPVPIANPSSPPR